MTEVYDKLVRDRIPEIIAASGHTAVTRILSVEEMGPALDAKLEEELDELRAAHGNADILNELADIEEVRLAMEDLGLDTSKLQESNTNRYLHTRLHHAGATKREMEEVRVKKRAERGGYDKRIFLEKVEEPAS